ncbi:fumarylacetoacetate hydrolase family protein [Georgenia sp. TF02-10]|uniref:fumarylacetoacetate hydrolase family protein n=1 Tax=Georgenia sp. TF02-10 TaxID=2917725 RepID=UPI001FA6C91F|nr:fumarylacetoacetate hydrolase family protein [Georgenia sp. TF02-10]UNX53882.1 fumarylacetoacetate hydrolase family protein [Georgenia sp. TF02-10]
MRIARFSAGEDPRYGVLDEEADELVVLRGDPIYGGLDTTGERVRVEDVRLLSPVIPRSKVIGIGRNYAAHATEMGNEVPAEPLVFLKPNTAVVGPNDPIVLPPYSQEVHHEAELAVVISRLCKYVPAERAGDVIFGYTAANDVTARDVQRTDGQWTRAKGFDTSCPLGPYLAVDIDVSDLAVRARVDGELRQDGRTSQLVRSVPELVAYVSSIFTLLPGDVILTGTPAGVGPIDVGQRVQVEVEGIGTLDNPVVRRD